ncbi:hypothetical protein [Micrococcus sp. TA1]|uniref:Gp37-like protein n=1 Tax=Micrococcus sp. TA1 TaxID=681627 RepID=UPI001607DCF1|nr:hypothetical protein [Micrococcus sp. TA1]MBB5748530.1 hypothetical protein [Micrococcus sp. TA1]
MAYDKTFKRLGSVGGYSTVDLTLIRNGVSACEVTVRASHKKAKQLREKGARITVTDDVTGVQYFSGSRVGMSGSGPADDQITFRFESDMRILARMLAWTNPAGNTTNQPTYKRYTSVPLETVLKEAASQNAARLGLPLTVAPTKGRGQLVNVGYRFEPILDKLQTRLDASNLTVTVEQIAAGWRLDVAESRVIRKDISVESGTLVSYDWDEERFAATRTLVAGQGEGSNRALATYVSTIREGDFGFPEEIFVDARDIEDAADLSSRGQEKLQEDADKSGLSIKLVETPTFKYGEHYRLGDTVTIETAAGPITDKIKQVQIVANRDNGLTITPIVGERSDSPDIRLLRYIKRFAGSLSVLQRG